MQHTRQFHSRFAATAHISDSHASVHSESGFKCCRARSDEPLSSVDEDQLGELPSSRSGKLDNLMSLPETLRKRSSRMVDNLELGTPLGRGSYGKVYKGESVEDMHWHGSEHHRVSVCCRRPHVLRQADGSDSGYKLVMKMAHT